MCWCAMKSDPWLDWPSVGGLRFQANIFGCRQKEVGSTCPPSNILLRPPPWKSASNFSSEILLRLLDPSSSAPFTRCCCWPRLGVIHPGQPITFLRGVAKRGTPACEFFTWGEPAPTYTLHTLAHMSVRPYIGCTAL